MYFFTQYSVVATIAQHACLMCLCRDISLTFVVYYKSSTSSYGELQIMKNNVMQLRVYQELDSNATEGTASGTTV